MHLSRPIKSAGLPVMQLWGASWCTLCKSALLAGSRAALTDGQGATPGAPPPPPPPAGGLLQHNTVGMAKQSQTRVQCVRDMQGIALIVYQAYSVRSAESTRAWPLTICCRSILLPG
jgi:hypothetical protein